MSDRSILSLCCFYGLIILKIYILQFNYDVSSEFLFTYPDWDSLESISEDWYHLQILENSQPYSVQILPLSYSLSNLLLEFQQAYIKSSHPFHHMSKPLLHIFHLFDFLYWIKDKSWTLYSSLLICSYTVCISNLKHHIFFISRNDSHIPISEFHIYRESHFSKALLLQANSIHVIFKTIIELSIWVSLLLGKSAGIT